MDGSRSHVVASSMAVSPPPFSQLRFKQTEAEKAFHDSLNEREHEAFRALLADAPIPADFCWQAYIVANGDLWTFDREFLAVQHYVQYGAGEQRRHKRSFDPAFFRDLYLDGADRSSAAELEELWCHENKVKFANRRELLWAGGFTQGSWPPNFNLQSYIVYNNLQPFVKNETQAIAHFLFIGLPQMFAISGALEFDPDFHRGLFDAPGGLSAPDLYRRWVEFGLPENQPANERHFLTNLGLSLNAIPDGFLWRDYLGDRPHLRPLVHNKWRAFEHFVLHGALERGSLPLTPDCSGAVLLAIADRFVVMGRTEDADRIYERIFLADQPVPQALQHAGDNAFRSGQYARALNMYTRVEQAGAASFWTYCNFIDAAIALGEFTAASAWVDKALAKFPRNQRLLAFHHTLLAQQLDLAIQRHITRLKTGDFAQAEISDLLRSELRCLYDRATSKYEIQFGPAPPRRAAHRAGRPLRLVLLANQDIAQCTYYRVTQKLELLALAGLETQVFPCEQAGKFRAALATADLAIFYRLATDIETLESVALCNVLGIPSIYEIDDLVFEAAHFPEPLHAYEGQLTPEQHFGLTAGVPLVASFAEFCTHGIASTAHLASHLAGRVASKRCAILRNGLSADLVLLSQSTQLRLAPRHDIRIFYGSGTRAHGADFQDLVLPALKQLLHGFPKLVFVACGHVDISELAALFPNQVVSLPLIEDRAAYLWQLRQSDINIAVLRPSVFNDAKSEIKWLEAAALGIPSVVSEVGGFTETLTHGLDVLQVAPSTREWARALRQLIEQPELRRNIGEQARRKALACYHPDVLAHGLYDLLQDIVKPLGRLPALPRARRHKPRVLIVNVFFPPQSIGGATRVVCDEAVGLTDRDAFEVAVLCGNDDPGPAYELTAYWTLGIKVFSINTPHRPHLDWQPDDPDMRPAVEAVLAHFQPELVHFHATQRLGISAVAAVRALGIPYLITVHDAWWISDHQFLLNGRDYLTYPWMPEQYGTDANPHSLEASAARRLKLMAVLAGADRVIAVSDAFAGIYRSATGLPILVLENAVSRLPPLQPVPAAPGKVRLGQIGGMTYHKGFFILKRLLTRGAYDRLELVVVDLALKAGERRTERWGKTSVTLIGKTPQDQAGWLFGQFDVLVALSTWPESFGLVTREALAYGKWIIASDRGAIGDVVVDGINGFRLDVDEPLQIAAAFNAIQNDPERFRNPPPPMASPFTLDAHLDQLTGIYQDVLRLPRAADVIKTAGIAFELEKAAGE